MKKGQGLSLNTIIIAAIVLIVLIVLWAIFTGRMGAFTAGIKEQDVKTEEAIKEIEGELGTVCTDGEWKCITDTTYQICANGEWGSTQTCLAGNCNAADKECTP